MHAHQKWFGGALQQFQQRLKATGVAVALLLLAASAPQAVSQEIKYSQDPNAAKRMTLLLKDFDPQPMVHLPVHEVPRAKFPVIDVHNHVNDAGGIHDEAALAELSPQHREVLLLFRDMCEQ